MKNIQNRFGLALCGVLALAACSDADSETSDGEGQHQSNCVGTCGNSNGTASNGAASNGAVPNLSDFGPAEPGDWTSFRSDALRTGMGINATVGAQVEEVWKVENHLRTPYSAAKPSGVVWADMLYWPTDDGFMTAFDRMTGEEKWSERLINGGNGIHGTPSVTKSVVIIGTYTGKMHALDRVTGEEVWSYKIGATIGSSPVYVHEDGAVYISHEAPGPDEENPGAGYVTRNNPFTGEEVWASEKLGHWPHASVSVDYDRNIVVVGANDGVIHGYDSETGAELWSRDYEPGEDPDPSSGDIKTTASLSADRGLTVFGTWDHHIYALNTETGEDVWSFDTGGLLMGSSAVDDTTGRVYVATLGPAGGCYGVDLDTGEQLWHAPIGASMSSPAVSGDGSVVVVGSNDKNLYALNAETGDVIWSFPTDGDITASPVLVGDMIYIAAKEGSLYALKTR